MPLPSGAHLGPYEIVGPLGSGGMGEVYRARDTRLGRDVALKVLAPAFVNDPERLARFELEARATAALNHPNILAVYDIGVDGHPYVVSELLEGETLRAALLKGAMPSRRAIDLAIQIARGLSAAHAKGIIHRDLKPENVFVTREGHAKILDFGLAKLTDPARERVTGSSATVSVAPVTLPGVVMGTVGYMAPEQVRGDVVDSRADVFAFGVMTYEMLSGRRAFARDTAVETMTAILNDEPPELTSNVGSVAPVIDRVVHRCLAKNPQQRFQSASDISFVLETLSTSNSVSSGTPLVQPRGRSAWTVAAVLVGAAALAGMLYLPARSPNEPPAGTPTFQPRTFDRLPITNARFMPDEQTIVYSAVAQGYTPELFVINPNTEEPRALGVPEAQLLSVSSKGELAIILGARHLDQRLYKGTLARMTLGSTPRPVLDGAREADWSPDGAALAVIRDLENGRDRLEYPIGTTLYEMTGYLSDVRVSPDGERIAFFEHPRRFDDRGWVKMVDRSGAVTTLAGEFAGLEGLSWTHDGSTVVFGGNAVNGYFMQPMAVPASAGQPTTTVLAVPGRFIPYDHTSDGRWLAVREDLAFGVRARVPGADRERELSWLGSVGVKSMSEDGQWLLMVDNAANANYGVVLRKTDGSQTLRLGEGNPQRLSPDGKWAAAIVSLPQQALVMYPTGPGEPIRISGRIERYESVEWFPDSRRLFVCGAEPTRAPRCYRQALDGSALEPLTAEGVNATLAPDGQTLLLARPGGGFARSSIGGGPETPVPALQADDRLIGWGRDSQSVFVQRGIGAPASVERVVFATGQRTVAGQATPDGVTAVTQINMKAWVADGRWYAYNYTTLPSTLFVVSSDSERRR